MKRKLLFVAFMMAILVFILAFSASAVTGSTSNEYGTVTYVEGISEVSGYDTTSRAVLKNADGTYTTYPAYYVYNGSTGTNMKVDLTNLKNATGEEYSKASLIRIEVFANSRLNWTFQDCTSLIDVYLPEGVWLHYGSFSGCSSLPTITLPESATTIPQSAFTSCSSLASIKLSSKTNSLGAKAFQWCSSLTRIDLPSGITSIPQDCFHGCTNLEYLKVPSSCKTIANYVTNGCSKIVWDLSEATSLESIGSNNSYGVTTSLVFHDGFKTISGVNSGKITELVFPNSTTSIGIIKCTSLQEFVIPAGVTTLGDKAFDYSTGLKKITIPKGLTTISSTGNTSFFHTTPTTVVFTGSEDAEIIATIKTLLPNATYEYKNHCDVYYDGIHVETDAENGNACYLVHCSRCDAEKMYIGGDMNSTTHSFSYAYAYNDGFTNAGTLTSTCANAGCNYCADKTPDVADLKAIFSEFKYSVRENDNFGIVMEYDIDTEALAIYEAGAGATVNYGVVAIAKGKYNSEKDLVKVDGTTEQTNIILADISGTGSQTVSLIIKGAESQWNQHKETEFYILGYAVNAGTVEYFQNATNDKAEDFDAISYNQAKGVVA